MNFHIRSDFKPIPDQQKAIDNLVDGIDSNIKNQVLLGVTGSGKTFTIANVIEKLQRPTLVITHNKTLAGQLYQEFRDFFPKNAVSYFVSYYDYYQPEAYIPQTDTYIEKETEINEEIDKLRLAATTNLLTRKDTIIVASVSCIYNIGSPKEYGGFVLEMRAGMKVEREQILQRLVSLQYERADYEFRRGKFRVRGEVVDIYPAYQDKIIRVKLNENYIDSIAYLEPVSAKLLEEVNLAVIYPAKHYMTDPSTYKDVFGQIKQDLKKQIDFFKKQGKTLEAYRIKKRVNYDLEMISQLGYVNGIENYSRYFDGRNPGEPPYTLLDYFQEPYGKDWLLVIDESHMTIPQLNGMYNGDRSRKQTLIDFGFRLPAALDNRPLQFEEFLPRTPQTVYVSATPGPWEKKKTNKIVEQLVRPTGILDPKITICKTKGQIPNLISEIEKRIKDKQRVLVTTLTKRTAEDLASFLNKKRGLKVAYLHSDVGTLDRQDILDDLRLGKYDVLIGINLLREGLDLPEVSLVAILDADKEGFLRSRTSLIQTMGRAARHISGEVIMYADEVTKSMKQAIGEVERRRAFQLAYNKKYNITPANIVKPIRQKLIEREEKERTKLRNYEIMQLRDEDIEGLTPKEKLKLIREMEKQMRTAARDLDFELAAKIRDLIKRTVL